MRALGAPAAAFLLLVFAAPVRGHTLFVANTGVDSSTCGAKSAPCRSISQAIVRAAAGDRVVVGPGGYREETGAAGCNCFLAIDKPLVITSSSGAASTVIDARATPSPTNVLITAPGSELGSPKHGFTVTNPGFTKGIGMEIDAADVKIRGNQLVADASAAEPNAGINSFDTSSGPVLVQGNQVMGWHAGIQMQGDDKSVTGNQVTLNGVGIIAAGTTTVQSNVLSSNGSGVFIEQVANALGNRVFGNVDDGFHVANRFTGSIAANDIAGTTSNCGLLVEMTTGVSAPNDYWGSPSGPGADPADDVCLEMDGTATTEPSASHLFKVKAPIRP